MPKSSFFGPMRTTSHCTYSTRRLIRCASAAAAAGVATTIPSYSSTSCGASPAITFSARWIGGRASSRAVSSPSGQHPNPSPMTATPPRGVVAEGGVGRLLHQRVRGDDYDGGRGASSREAALRHASRQSSASQLFSHSAASHGRDGSAPGGNGGGAAAATAMMRRHRHSCSHSYLLAASGVEVPGCGSGRYHLPGRAAARYGSGDGGSYQQRMRGGGANVGILKDAAPSAALGMPSPSGEAVRDAASGAASSSLSSSLPGVSRVLIQLRGAPLSRARRYETYERLLHRFVERGCNGDVHLLLRHPDAPAPMVVVEQVMHHRIPSALLLVQGLLAVLHAPRSGLTTATTAAFALERVATRLQTDPLYNPLYQLSGVKPLLTEALLRESLFDAAISCLAGIADDQMTPGLWSALVEAASQGKVPHSMLLWRLLYVKEEGPLPLLTSAGRSALLQQVAGTSSPVVPSSSLPLSWDTSAPHGGGIAGSTLGSAPLALLDMHPCMTVALPAVPLATTASSASSNLPVAPTAEPAEGVRQWCSLGRVEVGYTMEHHNSETAAAGDYRAAGAAGALYSCSSFQSLQEALQADGVAASSADPMPHQSQAALQRVRWATTAIRMAQEHQGVAYGLDTTVAAQLLLRCGVSFAAQATPLLAWQVMQRYLSTCRLFQLQTRQALVTLDAQLQAFDNAGPTHRYDMPAPSPSSSPSPPPSSVSKADQQFKKLYPNLARMLRPHPTPFLVFFKVMREARDVLSGSGGDDAAVTTTPTATPAASTSTASLHGSGAAAFPAGAAPLPASLPMVHWEAIWHHFQLLNRENEEWYTEIPNEASDLCLDVLEVMSRGADPWLILNVARCIAARHIVDGVELSLWLLHRLDPSHHTEEARAVAQKLFRWLLVDVGVHLQPSLHHCLIPAARALIRLSLQAELQTLYNAVLDNVYNFSTEHRDAFMAVLSDLICPACAVILPENEIYIHRTCPNCLTVVPAKDANAMPSFRLSAEHVERLRRRRRQQRQKSQRRLRTSVHRIERSSDRWSTEAAEVSSSAVAGGRRQPMDAAAVFRHEVLRDKTALLLPGVPVSAGVTLFSLATTTADGGDDGVAVLDLNAATAESTRRLALQRAARRSALARRGVEEADALATTSTSGTTAAAAVPSSVSAAATRAALTAAAMRYLLPSAPPAAASLATDGAWTCVWCQEQSSEWSSRVHCAACGAETGPEAPWRRFVYANDGDVMTELRSRIANCDERPIDAIVAGYLLMVYRRTFQLRAVAPLDYERLLKLVEVLCHLQERVLAGYVYIRLIPRVRRHRGTTVALLAQLFGQEESYRALLDTTPSEESQANSQPLSHLDDDDFFHYIFGRETCRVCFGQHQWSLCPIITRNFASSGGSQQATIRLSPEEKQRVVLQRLSQRITDAVAAGKHQASLVVDAYAAFVSSPFRETFAELHSDATNQLSMLLSDCHQYRRAAFVLCHIPLPRRSNAAYLKLTHYFNVTEAEAMSLLATRDSRRGGPPAPTTTTATTGDEHALPLEGSQPNFVQVTRTCCMCLDERHASFNCPRLASWLQGVQRLAAMHASDTATSESTGNAVVDREGEARLHRRLRAQVDGWTTAGPERLHAFYRYLLDHVDLLRPVLSATAVSPGPPPLQLDSSSPFVYAINKTITKLAAVGQRCYAYRLYARTSIAYVSVATTTAMLRMNGYGEDSIRALLRVEGSTADEEAVAAAASMPSFDVEDTLLRKALTYAPAAARAAVVPMQDRCLMCFSSEHRYFECPELVAEASLADRMLLVLRNIGGIACGGEGIGAAAAYVYYQYNAGRFSSEMLRSNPLLVEAMLQLARRCFATKQLAAGVRVLRRLPVEMVPPVAPYTNMWRAAGLPESTVEERRLEVVALYDAEGLVPSIANPPPRPTFSNAFLSRLRHVMHDGLCRHCFEHDHTIATCSLFHAEVSFGRDYVAAYRMSMMSEQLDREWQTAYLLKLVDFFSTHRLFMPYHIAGVANALNAITAMWSFRGEPGIALHHLNQIPPAYRRRQAFKHVLHCLRVSPADITRLLGEIYFAPDPFAAQASGAAGSSSSSTSEQPSATIMPQNLLSPRPAIRDVAVRQVLDKVPAAVVALEESATRMQLIRQYHQRRSNGNHRNSSSSSSSSSSVGGDSVAAVAVKDDPQHINISGSSSSSSGAAFGSPVLSRMMQSGGVAKLREDFDPILTELEDAVGIKLGSRHTLFASAIHIMSAATATTASSAAPPKEEMTAGDPATSNEPAETTAAATPPGTTTGRQAAPSRIGPTPPRGSGGGASRRSDTTRQRQPTESSGSGNRGRTAGRPSSGGGQPAAASHRGHAAPPGGLYSSTTSMDSEEISTSFHHSHHHAHQSQRSRSRASDSFPHHSTSQRREGHQWRDIERGSRHRGGSTRSHGGGDRRR